MVRYFKIAKTKGPNHEEDLMADIKIEADTLVQCWDGAQNYAEKNCPGYLVVYNYFPPGQAEEIVKNSKLKK